MLRHKHNRSIEGLIQGKIRKRGCSSSTSSSSSVIQNYRFKRALLVGKRGRGGGSNSTPVPTWRIDNNSSRSNNRIVTPNSNKQVSARKLVATLWQMNEVPSPRMKEILDYKKESRSSTRDRGGGSRVYSVLSDPSHSPVSDRLDRSRNGSHRRRNSITSQKLKLTDYINGGLDSGGNANLMEIRPRSRGMTPTGSLVGVHNHKTRLKDVCDGLTNSKELLKVLNRFWGVEEHQSASMSIISALRAEIERAHVQVNHLVRENPSSDRSKEMECLLKRFAQEKAAWKCNEQEKIEMALKPIKGDLEGERKLRRRTESLNKSLGRELAETKSALSKATKELETEKRAREIMEQICDELARGIGEDKAKVEALKRESAMVREEVEKEREMLHLADTLREERVQMKLCEAKYQFEEKNAAVDKLKFELETFLKTKKSRGNKNRSGKCVSKGDVAIRLSKPSVFDQVQGRGGEVVDEECNDGDLDSGEEEGSSDSDLHSIELNIEDANNAGYVWNFGDGAAKEDPKRLSVDKETKGRKSTSSKIPKRNFSIGRRDSDGIGWDFSTEDFSNWGKISELEKQINGQEHFEAGTQKHKSVKGPRDNMMSRSKSALPQDFASATKEWGQHWPSRDTGNTYCDSPNSNVAWESSLKERLAEIIGESRVQESEDSKKLSVS
ncbi:hypothetical protein MKW94_029566 [Papaver nudicaule]|uniref:Uncharacterized protein n=1 Tax=Papaver nudicaule TaxID=74823 RepID=A0AA41VZ33_PAPNU|nr:hypothetical protein [Papaver nudicaule]